jgi:DNA primase
MGRIPESELEQLKRDVSLERLVASHGVTLARHGEDLVARCPFHADDTPSLVISPESNLWHCLGACQRGGSVIDWVMLAEGASFRAAVEFLRHGGTPTVNLSQRGPLKRGGAVKQAPLCAGVAGAAGTAGASPSDAAVWQGVVQHYEEALLANVEARAYLASRGLDDEEAIRHFHVGFSNRTLGYRLPSANRNDGAALRAQLQALGIYRESGHEHLVGCITVPLGGMDALGEMYGRRIGKVEGGSSVAHLYTPGRRASVWNAGALAREVILCESVLDGLTFWVNGFRSVTCAYGVEGFSAAHFEAFRARGVTSVRIAYDRDDAGDAAAAKLSPLLNAAGIDTYRVLFPRGMDANAYALKLTPARESLGLVVRKAEWLGKGVAASAHEREREHVRSQTPEPVPASDPLAAISEARDVEEARESSEAREERDEEKAAEKPLKEESGRTSERVGAGHAERDELVYRFGGRTWRVRGLSKNTSYSALRVNLSVRKEAPPAAKYATPATPAAYGGGFFVDTLDLYAARPRAVFLAQASAELEEEASVIKRDMGEVLLQLEQAQEARMEALLAPCVRIVVQSPRSFLLRLFEPWGAVRNCDACV